jgi:hypothetical protein
VNNGDVNSTIVEAIKMSGKSEILLIFGSFTIMNEARRTLGYRDLSDPMDINDPSIQNKYHD